MKAVIFTSVGPCSNTDSVTDMGSEDDVTTRSAPRNGFLSGTWMALFATAFVSVAVLLIMWGPKFLVLGLTPGETVPLEQGDAAEWASILAQARQSIIFALGGVVAIFGFLLSYLRHRREERSSQVQIDQAKLQDDQHWTRRYTDAISQLGDNDSLSIRLGGIYALERLAKDAPSPSDRGTIAAVLAAHLREYSPYIRADDHYQYMQHLYRQPDEYEQSSISESEDAPEGEPAYTADELGLNGETEVRFVDLSADGANMEEAPDLRHATSVTDLKAAVEVLGRITTFGSIPLPVDLANTDLLEANLSGANLSGASLFGANVSFVSLVDADLSGANMAGATLDRALLVGANLREADLHDCNLTDAHLDNADLTGAELSRSALANVYISGAVFTDANLSSTLVRAYEDHPGQFDDIGGWDEGTQLPSGNTPKVAMGTMPSPPMHG